MDVTKKAIVIKHYYYIVHYAKWNLPYGYSKQKEKYQQTTVNLLADSDFI